MSLLEAPMLPSAALRQHYAFGVADRVAKVKASLHVPLLDGLGDLALALATRPLSGWSDTVPGLAQLMAPRWTTPEASAVIEVAAQLGLLVPTRVAGTLRPKDLGHFVWLGARRLSADPELDLEPRLSGLYFDMFAMAPALVTDRDRAAALVHAYAHQGGPWEDLVERGATLAATAVAWGAPVADDLRYHLLTRAEHWVSPLGLDWARELGAAILVEEAKNGPFRDEVVDLAERRLADLVSDALSDPDLAQNPAILASLDAQLAILVAGHTPNPATVADLLARLPADHAHRVPRALGQVVAPGEARNEALVAAARLALEAGDVEALGTLTALVEPLAGVIGPMHDLFQTVLEHPPGDLPTVYSAMAACRAIGHWESCPELTLHLLARLVASPADPDLRIAAAEALSRHLSALGRAHQILLDTLHGQLDLSDRAQAIASCAAALHLASPRPRLGALALAFAADGGPLDLLAHALDAGARWFPLHLEAFEETLNHYAGDDHVRSVALVMLSRLADRLHHESTLGPFFTLPPYAPIVRSGLARMVLPIVGDLSRPDWSAEAAPVCAWLLRGDPGYALTCLNLRSQATAPEHQHLYDLALGATGVTDPQILDRLGHDCAYAPPNLSAAAAVALRVLLETADQTPPLEPYLQVITERAHLPGPQQSPILHLLSQLATLPTG